MSGIDLAFLGTMSELKMSLSSIPDQPQLKFAGLIRAPRRKRWGQDPKTLKTMTLSISIIR
jgi:hypothetical protein